MTEMEWEKFPIIDWELANQLANYQADLAKDILMHLVNCLPNDMQEINDSFAANDQLQLLKQVHKLHGAVSYCGTPRLKAILALLEKQLKNNLSDDLPMLLHHLNIEANDFMKADLSKY